MSPIRHRCVICGEYVLDELRNESSKWLEEFRAIYSNNNGHFISGVGLYEDQTAPLSAPLDPTKRYDDQNHDDQPTQDFYIMGYSQDGLYGYISHDACWKVLKEAAKPNEISVKRFIEICASLPFPADLGFVDWGHTYGGIYDTEFDPSYKWETRLLSRLPSPTEPNTMHYTLENPYQVPEIPKILTKTAHLPENLAQSYLSEKYSDCFARFPWEIREIISQNLSTRDALSLRMSSRSFLPILNSPTFWASRFTSGSSSDRGFLFEKRKSAEARDWHALYRLTDCSRSPPGLRNRQRIWGLVNYIIDLLNMSSKCDTDMSEKHDEVDHPDAGSNFVSVCGDVQSTPQAENFRFSNFRRGCRILRKQRVSMPQRLTGVILSFIQFEGHRHLSGLRLKSKDDSDIQLGYSSTENTVACDIEHITGFVLAVHSRGIRAVQIIDGHGDRSPWLGSPEGAPITERLTTFQSIQSLQVGIDGYKIVSIAASGPRTTSCLDQLPDHPIHSELRTKALWYPSPPASDINLNEDSFRGEAISTEYRPLSLSYFGGSKGSKLPSLINMTLTAYPHPQRIDFEYTKTEPCHSLGRYVSKVEALGRNPKHTTTFSIDGPGGEFIQCAQVAMRDPSIDDCICALKFITNKGRSFQRGDTEPTPEVKGWGGVVIEEAEPEAIFEPLKIAPGTTITGFYANYHINGLINFGVISEVVKRKAITQDSI